MKKLIYQYRKWSPSSYATILFLISPFFIYLLIDFKLNNDFWFLINTGKTIVKEGFITIEPFTIHSDLFFIPQQWLTDVIFNFIYTKYDIRGMFYFIILCNSIIIYLSYKICYLVSNSKIKSIIITIIVDSFLLLSGVVTTRPQIFDIIMFLLELYLLELYIDKNNKKYLYFIPFISLFLINAHASMWMMLFVFMIPYITEWIIQKHLKKDTFKLRPLVVTIIISLLVGLINPYGIEAIKYLFNSYGVDRINAFVNEMKPISIGGPFGLIIMVIIFIILVSFYKNKGKNKIRYFLLSMGIIFLTLMHVKARLELGVIIPLIIGYNIRNDNKESKVKVLLYEKILYSALILGSIFIVVNYTVLSDDIEIKEFADYLDENASKDIKLFTNYNTGGYMEYRGYKCYIDPRAEVFLKSNNRKEDIFDEYFSLEIDVLDPKEFLDKYDFDYLLVNNKSYTLVRELQRNDDYNEIMSKPIESEDDMIEYLFKKIEKKKESKKS